MIDRDGEQEAAARQEKPTLAAPVHLSVLAPIRNEEGLFQEHVRACHAVLADLGVELVLIDNQSTNGCTHGLPRDVLILRMETEQSLGGLWRHGCRLASGATMLWIPRLAANTPEALRVLVLLALSQLITSPAGRPRAMHLRRALVQTCVIRSRDVCKLRSLATWPRVGWFLARLAERWLVTANLVSAPISEEPTRRDTNQAAPLLKPTAPRPFLSVIITAHNEGDEVLKTVQSVQAHAGMDHEIIVVDDGSTDGSCEGLEGLGARVIKVDERIGVAYSRHLGTRHAVGDAFAYLDGHQRVDPGCLDRATAVAIEYQAIACPPCRPLYRRYPVGYGASFRLCPKRGIFDAFTRGIRPRNEVSWISALRSPGYVIPRCVYDRVAWIDGLRGWGATDLALGVKTFFTDVDILHVDVGATHHLFRKAIPYPTTSEGVWRNHALIARVCFDEGTWNRYWYPKVFNALLTDFAKDELNSPAVLTQHAAFQEQKSRPDREFWRGLLRVEEPTELR